VTCIRFLTRSAQAPSRPEGATGATKEGKYGTRPNGTFSRSPLHAARMIGAAKIAALGRSGLDLGKHPFDPLA
jgi:hypothetical protein